MFKFLTKFIKNSSLSLMSLVFTGLIIFGGVYFYMVLHLPDVSQLKEMGKQIPLRVYTSDGKFIKDFGEKKRIPITLKQVPKQLMQAVLDTEDQRFYEHRGVDFLGLLRATKAFIASGKKSQGGSTITMQVARDFCQNRKKTFSRKLNEILLAFKIEEAFSKEEILELYLNQIYFGNRAYGIAAASQVYYGKPLNELTLAQIAMLAGLPQAPSRDNPILNPQAARERRNHILQRMLEHRHINLMEYNTAVSAPIAASYHELQAEASAPYLAEMVRNAVISQYGDGAYAAGMKIYTSIDSRLQAFANQALHDGILAYDQRHGYRGPEGHLAPGSRVYWRHKLKNIPIISDLQPVAVISSSAKSITVLLSNGTTTDINANNFAWANPQLTNGDIIRIYKTANNQWKLAQLPKIEGAIIVLDPKNGAILALSGGFSYANSSYNRAIQAERQPGSSFKPFVYSAALEKGFTFASLINDTPLIITDQYTKKEWRPQNDSQDFLGPISLREALFRSRNVASVRLLQSTGVSYVVDYLKKFGFSGPEVPQYLTLALGVGNITPLKMTEGYAVFANGGYKITPFFINSIVDADNKNIFQAKPTIVPEIAGPANKLPLAPRVITPQNAYLITDSLKDVIKKGTAKKALALRRSDIAGKTGTTNDLVDAWFLGFNSDLVATVWIGFDQPHSTHEHGSQAALPIWIQFMQNALVGKPEHSMRQPEGITTARIDPATGLLAEPEQENAIFEMFTVDTVPKTIAPPQTEVGSLNLDDLEITTAPLF
ncbi:Penicillin-insensitive transglycosylase / Penicillin-sensitive transpeptidase [Gammaproteobacteria bacterium]